MKILRNLTQKNILTDFYPKFLFLFLLFFPLRLTAQPENSENSGIPGDFPQDALYRKTAFSYDGDFETWLCENFGNLEYGNPVYEDGKLISLSFFSAGIEICKEYYYYDKNSNPLMSKTVFSDKTAQALTGKVIVNDGTVELISYSNFSLNPETPEKKSTVTYFDDNSRETEKYTFENGKLIEQKKTTYLTQDIFPHEETTVFFIDDAVVSRKKITTINSQGNVEKEVDEYPAENKLQKTFYTYAGNSTLTGCQTTYYENNLQIKNTEVRYKYKEQELDKELYFENDKLISEINYINENEFEKIIYKNNQPILKAIYSSGKKIYEKPIKNKQSLKTGI